jgi:hypothetical protein
MDALAAARDGHRFESHPLQNSPGEPGDFGAFREATAWPRVKVEHNPVGILRFAVGREPPLRYVDLEGAELRETGEGGEVGHERVDGDPLGVPNLTATHPVGGALVKIFVEKRGARIIGHANAVYPAFASGRPFGCVPNDRRRDTGVVRQDIGLGRAGLGIHHLVEVGEHDSAGVYYLHEIDLERREHLWTRQRSRQGLQRRRGP